MLNQPNSIFLEIHESSGVSKETGSIYIEKKNYCGEKKFMEWLKCCKFPTAVEIELSMKNNHQKLEKKISCLMS